MKSVFGAFGVLMLSTTLAHAVGLDRSNQDIGIIFEDGGIVKLSFGYVMPSLEGTDVLGNEIDNVGADFSSLALALKMDVNAQLSFGLIIDQPYGVDIAYGGAPATTMFGGTAADLSSRAFTAMGRYQINDNFSVHAGLRQQAMEANVTLSGAAFGALSGYNVDLNNGTGTGWLAGVAYERPDIALRVALTYFSAVDNEFDTVETVGGVAVAPPGTTTVTSPEAINLDFQTGIAANTLLFGQIRYAAYSQTILSPTFFAGATGGGSITDIDDGTSYSIGVGRRFSDSLSASLSAGWEAAGASDLVSPLSPTNGNTWLAIGAQYTMGNVVLSGGVRYTWLGDAQPETGTPDVARADFEGNSALAAGISIAYKF